MRTAECVTPRHPDKMCDQISDAVLDWCLQRDPNARVAIEAMGGHGEIYVCGEITAKIVAVPTEEIVREIVERVTGTKTGLLRVNITAQSPEIANGVDTGGAGDQGIMVGYACNDNDAMIPQELYLARHLAQSLYEKWPYDGKTQITMDDNNDVITIVASFQNTTHNELEEAVLKWVEEQNVQCTPDVKVYANPAGDWAQGGFDADTGLTGRKLMVDNYGPQIPIGGGAFSGKDATKVDRSAAYMARKCAVTILKERNAKEVMVKLAYAIGVAEPVMAIEIVDGVENNIGSLHLLTPKAIIEHLELNQPNYEATAMWGHFGNGFRWDK